jgi:hypothetical protein
MTKNKLEERSKKIMKKQADGLDVLATKLTGDTQQVSGNLDKMLEQISEGFIDLTTKADIPFGGEIKPPKITRITKNNPPKTPSKVSTKRNGNS